MTCQKVQRLKMQVYIKHVVLHDDDDDDDNNDDDDDDMMVVVNVY